MQLHLWDLQRKSVFHTRLIGVQRLIITVLPNCVTSKKLSLMISKLINVQFYIISFWLFNFTCWNHHEGLLPTTTDLLDHCKKLLWCELLAPSKTYTLVEIQKSVVQNWKNQHPSWKNDIFYHIIFEYFL
jgi:hypothetical protein